MIHIGVAVGESVGDTMIIVVCHDEGAYCLGDVWFVTSSGAPGGYRNLFLAGILDSIVLLLQINQ